MEKFLRLSWMEKKTEDIELYQLTNPNPDHIPQIDLAHSPCKGILDLYRNPKGIEINGEYLCFKSTFGRYVSKGNEWERIENDGKRNSYKIPLSEFGENKVFLSE